MASTPSNAEPDEAHHEATQAFIGDIPWYERLAGEAYADAGAGVPSRNNAPLSPKYRNGSKPAQPQRPVSRKDRTFPVASGFFLCSVLFASLCVWQYPQVLGRFLEREPHYLTTPEFSVEAFSRIRAGMSTAQVRALVGNPLWRVGVCDGLSSWFYSGIRDDPRVAEFRLYGVVFDKAAGTVVRTVNQERSLKKFRDRQFFQPHFEYLSRQVGDVSLRGSTGQVSVLQASDAQPCLLLVVPGGGGHSAEAATATLQRQQQLREQGFRVLAVSSRSAPSPWLYSVSSKALVPSEGLQSMVHPYVLMSYWHGELRLAAPAQFGYSAHDNGEDEAWFLEQVRRMRR